MQKFGGFEAAQEAAKRVAGERLPVGAYECEVKNVQYVAGENGNSDRIDILFDIAAGDQKDFFKKQYDNNTAEDKKWKGRKSIYVPTDDGSERDGWTKNTFAKWTNAFEESNEGYHWDWDESKWKGKKIGIVFGETGTKIEGKDIVYTEARYPVSVEKVRTGKAGEAKFKAKNGYGEASSNDTGFVNVPEGLDEELPF